MKRATSLDIQALRKALAESEARADMAENWAQEAEAKAATAIAKVSNLDAIIAAMKLQIETLRRELYGQRSERKSRLLDQLELQLEELETKAGEDGQAAEQATDKVATVERFTRRQPSRKPFPEHLPRERVVLASPQCCAGCGSERLTKLGEDITETLEVVPRQWIVIQTVREKFACRDCENVQQPPAPFHATPRGWAGPNLLAMILFEKFGQHQPLNRQAERYGREGVELSLSTLADQVGACTAILQPLHDRIADHVLSADRLHGDDTTVPVLAKGRTVTGRIWTYVRDDKPFGGSDPPAALFHYSRDRTGAHPKTHLAKYGGILQADAYAGYGGLYDPGRSPGPVTEALCWAHARRKFFVLADIASKARKSGKGKQPDPVSPLAWEAVRRIDEIFDIERAINGKTAEQRLAARAEFSAPLVAALDDWMDEARRGLSKNAAVAKAMDYMLKRRSGFHRFLSDGRICLTNNAAERALRGIALGRKSWMFAGSDRGGQRAAAMYSLIATAKLNDIDPQAWLADIIARIASHPAQRIDELLPWNWKAITTADKQAA